ncbi:MAG: 2-amino-3,7-dideoxy-D-threo-hept-6-ulosonate synthase [Thermoleophilia bacterium]
MVSLTQDPRHGRPAYGRSAIRNSAIASAFRVPRSPRPGAPGRTFGRVGGSYGKQLRLIRLSTGPGTFIVPLDHAVTVGPIGDVGGLVSLLARAGVDAVVLHKGAARRIDPVAFAGTSLVVHLSAGTGPALDPYSKVLVASVEEALALGADAVSVHVNIGAPTEPDQLRDLGEVARECETLGVPLLAMMYARGPAVPESAPSAATLAHLAAIAADLGADMVKLAVCDPVEDLREVVASCDLPIVIAGGAPEGGPAAAVALASAVMDAGAAGLSFGRQIFTAPDPYATARRLADLAHGEGGQDLDHDLDRRLGAARAESA